MCERAFGMLGAHVSVTSLAMLDGFFEMLNSFVQMRVLYPCRLSMLQRFFSMFYQCIGMTLLSMRRRFLRVFDSFSDMLVGGER